MYGTLGLCAADTILQCKKKIHNEIADMCMFRLMFDASLKIQLNAKYLRFPILFELTPHVYILISVHRM